MALAGVGVTVWSWLDDASRVVWIWPGLILAGLGGVGAGIRQREYWARIARDAGSRAAGSRKKASPR